MKTIIKKVKDWFNPARTFEQMEKEIFEAETIRFARFQLEAEMLTVAQRGEYSMEETIAEMDAVS